ncbi:DUF2511 domain-containing protein [Stutzerimonas nitrititolerans]|uniref:DUF2511 domain-containing protein n=1 Tax=Stutzerimonas nitrititolerans TaxID=2482751 RepID=UPI0028A89D59|nr:DUF2511 domain-containing protein [Stutzerimonas nitrititolerans]
MRNLFFGLLLAAPLALAAPPKLISAEDFGDAWPFVPEEMHLQCLPGNAVVVTDPETGRMYGLNGAASGKARQFGLDALDLVWAENDEIPGTKIGLGKVIEAGNKLCSQTPDNPALR